MNRAWCGTLAALALLGGAGMAKGQSVPPKVAAMIAKSKSFGLGKYPISFWSYTNLKEHGSHFTEAEVASWADAGFTVPQTPSCDPADLAQKAQMLHILDWIGKHGIKAIVCDPRSYWRPGEGGKLAPDFADKFRAAVKDFGAHPAVFGFHVGDEPDADAKKSFFEACRVQKEIAPKLHPYANLLPWFPGIEKRAGTDTWPNYLDEFAKDANADLVSYDCYAQMNPGESGWAFYFENLRLYREAALRNGIPFWNTLLSVGHFNYRVPNEDEIRWQFNTTIASGAHGILWFFYYMRQPEANYRTSPVDEHWNRTPTYDYIRRVQKSFHKRYGDLFTRLACTRVRFFPKALGQGEEFVPDGIVSAVSGGRVLVSTFVDEKGQRYAMIVNLSMTESSHVSVTFPGADVKVFSWDWNGHEYEGNAYSADSSERKADGLVVNHWLAPGQEAMYRVQSAAAAKEPVVR